MNQEELKKIVNEEIKKAKPDYAKGKQLSRDEIEDMTTKYLYEVLNNKYGIDIEQ